MKLDSIKANIIRYWYKSEKFTIEEMAKFYDVSEQTIKNCINNKTFNQDG